VKAIKFWGRHFLALEFWFSVVAALGVLLIVEHQGYQGALLAMLRGCRSTLYSTVASIAGSLLGFVITAASVILAFANTEHLAVLRQSAHYPTIWRTFISTIRALAVLTGVAVAAIVLDRDETPRQWVLYLVAWGCLYGLLRMLRCVWIFEAIIQIVTRDVRTAPPGGSGK